MFRQSIENEIELVTLLEIIWKRKRSILLITSICCLVSLVISLNLPNIYRSSTLLAGVEDNTGGGMSSLSGQLGGLASLAGVSMSKVETSRVVIAMAIVKSRSFVKYFVNKHDLSVPLLAAKGWNAGTDQLQFDSDIYDETSGKWVSAEANIASDGRVYKVFTDALSINQDKVSGLVTITFESLSPSFSRKVLSLLVDEINERMRERDVIEAKDSVTYLNSQLEKTSLKGMQQVFYQLIEKQMQKMMLAEVRNEYVFKIIDPPDFPEERIRPKRIIILIITAACAFVISCAIMLVFAMGKELDRNNS